MGRTCNAHVKDENCVRNFSPKFQRNAPLVNRRSVGCWEYNIKIDGINLIHDKIKLRTVFNYDKFLSLVKVGIFFFVE